MISGEATGGPRLGVRGLSRGELLKASFELRAGECVCLRGDSGAGKSVLLRALADLDPTTGSVALDGIDRAELAAPEWRRRVVYVPADSGWWAETVGEHFRDFAALVSIAEGFGLSPEVADWKVERLSTGERQRLALLRALELAPDVYLLDEPTSGLDEVATRAVEAELARRCREGAAILWVTHDAAQERRVATRTMRVERGCVTEAAR